MKPEYMPSADQPLNKAGPGAPSIRPAKGLWMLSGFAGCSIWIASVEHLSYSGKTAFIFFIIAMALWIFTKMPAGWIALGALVCIVALKGAPPSLLYESIAEEIVWLMIGSFIIGESVKTSGLAARFTRFMLLRARKPEHFLWWLAFVIQPLTFFIPSTSGRAALTLPIVRELHALLKNDQQKKSVAMLLPVMILLASSATVIGAGSHIIGIGLLNGATGADISYVTWVIWGAPFALVMCGLALLCVKIMFWKDEPQSNIIPSGYQYSEKLPLSGREKKTLGLIAGMVVLWMTEGWHGYDIAFITMAGAMLLMLPSIGIMEWKQGMKSVSWNLIMFVAAATALGKALVENGVVDWLQQIVFSKLRVLETAPPFITLLIIILVSVTSHLYITSHTTRAVVMIPAFIVLGQTLQLDASAVVFLTLVGMNYCITFPVSSKALLLYYEDESVSYPAKDLVKLSMVCMPLYVGVMVLFYYTYWQWTGLRL
ncbi:SLC13 family permease [Paenibacillus glucanolyticus]|uniref:SLC13 family permease n=1 Tax=Paenibacillus glucanolyticus TaxID=59843 RepID=UPI0030C8FC02